MKKIGILTFHCADNYGAVLQAYALSKKVRDFGFDVEFINFVPPIVRDYYESSYSIKESIAKYGIKHTIRRKVSDSVHFSRNNYRLNNFNDFRSEFLNISPSSYNNSSELKDADFDYDYVITGSDQVWNPDFFIETGGAYFLDFVKPDAKKISYAPSIARELEEKHYQHFRNYLKDFDNISIRERSAHELIIKLTDKPVDVTIDPTFLLESSEWMAISTKVTPKEAYILVYDLIKDPITVAITNKLSQQKGYKVISYSNGKGYSNWSKSFAGCNPIEFLGLIQNANFIVTSSFHGTAFAIIFNKSFYTISHPTRGSRMVDLLTEIGLESQLVANSKQIIDANLVIDYDRVNNSLSILRTKSLDFIKDSLDLRIV